MLGSHLGIPAGSGLLDHQAVMRLVNAGSVVLDSVVILLALALVRPWGRLVPAWLLLGPAWVATGLLAPIVIGVPIQTVVMASRGGPTARAEPELLEPWVFAVVYGGFGLQALGLGILFVLHVGRRWGGTWTGRVGDLPNLPVRSAARTTAAATSVLATVPFVTHVVWAAGSTAGMSQEMAGDRGPATQVLNGVTAALLAAGVVGVLSLAFWWGRRVDARVPLLAVSGAPWSPDGRRSPVPRSSHGR